MLCSPPGPSSWKLWPSLGHHRARPAEQRLNLPHPSPKTQNENWCSRKDDTDLAFQFARTLGREVSAGNDQRLLKEVRKTTFAGGIEKFARGDRAFAVTSAAWDQDPFLLGTPGGTVDLRTGQLRPADPADGVTKITAVAPAERADCSRWLQFLNETFGGDAGLIRFLQQWCGYCLTGDVREHALVFGSGSGGNGKSVLVNTISGLM